LPNKFIIESPKSRNIVLHPFPVLLLIIDDSVHEKALLIDMSDGFAKSMEKINYRYLGWFCVILGLRNATRGLLSTGRLFAPTSSEWPQRFSGF